MPTVRKPHAYSAHRRVASSQPSPTRPVIKAAIANANGTVNPTNPRYRIGGWDNTKMWVFKSGVGPREKRVKGGVGPGLNASIGPNDSKKKNAVTTNITTSAHASNGSSRRRRYRRMMTAV